MCRVDILGTYIVSAWYSSENRVRHKVTNNSLSGILASLLLMYKDISHI